MGVLSKLTDEYFGKTIREEDCIQYSIDNNFPTRELTSEEKAFLSALANHILLLDKSLFFQVCNLQQHTKLVLSGETETACRSEFPNPDVINSEIEELEKMIKEFSDKLEQDVLQEENMGVLEIWERQLKELKDAQSSTNVGVESTKLLGRYEHNNGTDSKVILYVKNIEERAKKIPCDTKFLMGQVLLHEYFHSFYFHVGTGMRNPLKYMEEPMAEYGSLVALDSVASSGSSVATEAGEALRHTLGFVKDKQKCTGLTAAYGFGAYLYEKHKDDFLQLIAKYANVSRLMEKCEKESREYKYMLYPKYPFPSWVEDTTYKKLGALLKVVVVRESNAMPFVRIVFEYLKDNDLLDCLAPFIQFQGNGNKYLSVSQAGIFCLRSILCDNSTPPPVVSHGPFIIGGQTYHLCLPHLWNYKSKTSRCSQLIDEFIKMINYVYRGQFDIQKSNEEYIMSYDVINH